MAQWIKGYNNNIGLLFPCSFLIILHAMILFSVVSEFRPKCVNSYHFDYIL